MTSNAVRTVTDRYLSRHGGFVQKNELAGAAVLGVFILLVRSRLSLFINTFK